MTAMGTATGRKWTGNGLLLYLIEKVQYFLNEQCVQMCILLTGKKGSHISGMICGLQSIQNDGDLAFCFNLQ